MYDVITIGAGVRDVFVVSDKFIALHSDKFATGVGECVALGSKVELDKVLLTTGGGATNAAATFGSLGLKTACICKVGDDSPGRDVIADLKHFGVSTHLVHKDPRGQTGYSTLLTMQGGERTALVYRGVSGNFKTTDINVSIFKRTRWVYLTSLGGNTSLAKYIIDEAHKTGARVMWNPGSKELEKSMRTLLPLIKRVDILNLNLEELGLLTGEAGLEAGCDRIHTPGTIRLITDGTNGAYAYQDGTAVHASTTDVKSVNRTGAGDAFGSGFLAGLIKTNRLDTALQLGTLNAESVIQKHGPKHGLLSSWPSKKSLSTITITDL